VISRSFVDLLFILLCGAVVMLANSVPLRLADASPAKVAGGGRLDLAGRTLRVLVVGPDRLRLDGEAVSPEAAVAALGQDDRAVLLPESTAVTHHRMLAVWSRLRGAGIDADLGVLPEDAIGGD
jgi:hypothetical protein